MSDSAQPFGDPSELADELSKVRQRGLLDLEVDAGRPDRQRVETDQLDRLAQAHAEATGTAPLGRIDALLNFMRDGI